MPAGGTAPEFYMDIEEKIAAEFLTEEHAKESLHKVLESIEGSFATKDVVIPRLLSTAWHDFVNDRMWDVVKEHDDATISVKRLRDAVQDRLKEILPDVFD